MEPTSVKHDPTINDVLKRLNEMEKTLWTSALQYFETMKKEILDAVDSRLDIYETNYKQFQEQITKRVDGQDESIKLISKTLTSIRDSNQTKDINSLRHFIYGLAILLVFNSGVLIYLLVTSFGK